jgi:hypothetical protein
MRRLLIPVALVLSALLPATTSAAPSKHSARSAWATQANQVCTAWLAKAKTELGTATTTAQLYPFATRAKTLESQELGLLVKIPGRSAAGSAALAAVRVDLNELGTAIAAWKAGKQAQFIQGLKKYLNDNRPRAAFAMAGASKCG